ncbi:hypothetical protein BHE74_00056382 [Ensete ventricosum]|nr:hypothetical protein BHE74_00056382 [Ensete ventricosum]
MPRPTTRWWVHPMKKLERRAKGGKGNDEVAVGKLVDVLDVGGKVEKEKGRTKGEAKGVAIEIIDPLEHDLLWLCNIIRLQ